MAPTTRDVWRVLRDGKPRSALDLVGAVGGTTASVTARVRDLRKPAWGEHLVICRRDERGVFVYQIAPRVALNAGG